MAGSVFFKPVIFSVAHIDSTIVEYDLTFPYKPLKATRGGCECLRSDNAMRTQEGAVFALDLGQMLAYFLALSRSCARLIPPALLFSQHQGVYTLSSSSSIHLSTQLKRNIYNSSGSKHYLNSSSFENIYYLYQHSTISISTCLIHSYQLLIHHEDIKVITQLKINN